MKVLINRDPRMGPYGGGNLFVRAFHELAKDNGIQIVKSLSASPDILFVFHPDAEPMFSAPDHVMYQFDENYYKPTDGVIPPEFTVSQGVSMRDAVMYRMTVRKDAKIVIRVNECDARKGTKGVDEVWNRMISVADHVFFVSDWMKQYFNCDRGEVLVNGIDKSRFKRQPKISSTNGKVNIVCAHWSDNALKGQDTYEFLDKFVAENPDFTFTYIGRTKANLKNSTILPPLNPEELAKELTRYDVCVNGTYWDPGPNAVMESIAAGLPTYVRREGGGAAEFAGAEHVYNSMEELKSVLLARDFRPNVDRFDSWEVVMKRFFERLKALK